LRLSLSTPRQRIFAILGLAALVAIVLASLSTFIAKPHGAHANATQSHYWNKFGDEASRDADAASSPSQELYDNLAYPATDIDPAQRAATASAWQAVTKHSGVPHSQYWNLVGPTTPNVSADWTYTGLPSITSGRTTAIAVSNTCGTDVCRVWIGAAGGGVWTTNNGLAQHPSWHASSDGLDTNAIGSLALDPNDASGRTIYVGTGEPNGSGDSEAGTGLYKSTDYGANWSLVSGSPAVANGRSIGSIAIDPSNASHIFIGTDVARHGSSSANGGRFTPPGSPQVGLYESTNGGATFSLVFFQTSDTVNPASATGGDFFRGGVTKVKFDPTTPGRVYFSMFDYGLFRSKTGGGYEQVFTALPNGSLTYSSVNRVEFDLAPLASGKLRIYLGDARTGTARLYRVDDAGVPASTLTFGGVNIGWTPLSNSTNGTPGFASYNFCGGQCSYDMPVASPQGQPDNVWIGGQMQYGELSGRSNGRAIQRSTDKGVSFTDMTNDMQFNGMHPDQHVIAFVPSNPDIAFIGSDGGVVRTSGQFGNMATDPNLGCGVRGLSGANLTDCTNWLSAVPTQIFSLNDGLATMQFQSVSVNVQNPKNDIMGGTQDNGTWIYSGPASHWIEAIGGDGGQSGINVAHPNIRFHSFFAPQHDVNFQSGDPLAWDWIADPLGNNEVASFYVPMIYDPNSAKADTMFEGEQHIFRTTDNAGAQAYLDLHCNEFTGDFAAKCGDWVPMGGVYVNPSDPFPVTNLNDAGDLTGTFYGTDKSPAGASYVVAISRAPSNTGTLWAGTRRGRVFVSTNADASDASTVAYDRIDISTTTPGSGTPTRFVSGIAVDPADPNHAYVSFSGYDAYATAAGTATGHVFDVHYNSTTHSATWTDISHDLGDVPVTGIALDSQTGDLYASSDFGVAQLASGATSWVAASPGLPTVTVYGLTIVPSARILYAATHGRGIYSLNLGK
jgi:hypothetical protein